MADKSSLEPHPLGSNQGVPTAIFCLQESPPLNLPRSRRLPRVLGSSPCLPQDINGAVWPSYPAPLQVPSFSFLSLARGSAKTPRNLLSREVPGRASRLQTPLPTHTPCSPARYVALATADGGGESSIPGAETRGREPPRLPCRLLFKFGNHEGAWLRQPRLRHHPETSVAPGEKSSWCPKLNPW